MKLAIGRQFGVYGLAVALTATTWLLRSCLVTGRPVLILFILPIFLSAYFGGLGPGLTATFLSAIAADYLPPYHIFDLGSTVDSVQWAVLCASGVLIAVIHQNLRRSQERLAQERKALALARDDAERRALEAEEARRTLRALLEYVPEGIAITGGPPAFTIQTISRIGLEMSGRPAAELTGFSPGAHQGAWDLFLSDGVSRPSPEEMPLYRATRFGEETRNFEMVLRKASGEKVPLLVNAAPVRNAQGCVVGAINCWRDISDRKKAGEERERLVLKLQETVAEAERRAAELTAVIESMPDAVYIGTKHGIGHCNGRALEMLGAKSLAELQSRIGELGARFAVRWPDSGQLLREDELQFSRALNGETVVQDVLATNLSNGRDLHIRSACAPILVQGKVIGAVAINSDITERHRAQESLRYAKEQLARANADLEQKVKERTAKLNQSVQELERFSYSIAHDMRSPLRAMQGYAQALLDDYGSALAPEAQDYLQRISRAALRQNQLIQDVLHYSQIARTPSDCEPVDLSKLLEDILRHYRSLRENAATIDIQTPLGRVLGHAALLMQCLSNLLENAVKFVAPGTVPRVKIWSELAGPNLRLWIEDNGIGIAPENHQRIFDIFERIHSVAEFEGTGIGLAIVRTAAERMGGQVGLKSELGQGSRFWLELAAAPPSDWR